MGPGLARRVLVASLLAAALAAVSTALLAAAGLHLVAAGLLAFGLGVALAPALARLAARGPVGALRGLEAGMRKAAADHGGPAAVPLGPDEVSAALHAFSHMEEAVGNRMAALERELARMEAAFGTGTNARLAIDSVFDVRYLNDAAARLFHVERGAATGMNFLRLVRDHEIYAMLRSSIERGQPGVAIVDYGPSRQYLQVTVVPLAGAGEWAAVADFVDLTEVRRLEGMRRDFVSNVSHELRTPLASIKAVVETLEAGAIEEPEVARDFLRRVDGEVDRLTGLVEELLELSRLESGSVPVRMESTDVRALLAEAVGRMQPQAQRAGLDLAHEDRGEVPPIQADPERIQRAVINLVQNAIKFTPAGGRVRVWADASSQGVSLHVSDTGVGIMLDDQPRVFERFFKADRARSGGGAGLGLAIVKHVAQAHGGTVSLTSTPGAGSEFVITLPTGA